MHLDEAKRILLSDQDDGRVVTLVQAAATICSPSSADKVSLRELLACLERGNGSENLKLVAEYAALALYSRTNRQRDSIIPGGDFITDAKDWYDYLRRGRWLSDEH